MAQALADAGETVIQRRRIDMKITALIAEDRVQLESSNSHGETEFRGIVWGTVTAIQAIGNSLLLNVRNKAGQTIAGLWVDQISKL